MNFFEVGAEANLFDESFGFTDEEVQKMLTYYGLEEDYEIVKAWYDGYRFGDVDVYCPWDVINYCSDRQYDPKLEPQNIGRIPVVMI